MEEDSDLYDSINEKISFGHNLIYELENVEYIDGVPKLQRKIKQEIKFLEKVLKTGLMKTEYLQSTNLNYFSAIVKCILNERHVTHVDFPVIYNNKKIHVDVVCDNGNSWIKVVARNKKSLSEAVLGETNQPRTILDQSDNYINAARMHPIFFKVPKVIFLFAGGIDDFLKEQLESKGVVVLNCLLKGKESFCDKLSLNSKNHVLDGVKLLNLDITTMLAYVSNLSNGHCNRNFKEPLLSEQAKWEGERPVKHILNKLFVDKELICCETARIAFENIVQLIGGPEEKLRAKELLTRVNVLPDNGSELQNSIELNIGGRVKHRSKKIFIFGHYLHAITVTANEGFVRAAKQQGIEFAVYVHEPRALTEMKEI